MAEKRIYIVDAHGFLHRNYHALPKLTTSKGEEVGAIYGFTRMLLKIIREKKPEYFAVCFDSPGKTFRYEIFPEYKSNRKKTEDSLKNQLHVAREIVTALGLSSISAEGVEADDIMATIARIAEENGFDAVIITTDKDMLQIVNEKIKLWDANNPVFTDYAAVLNKFKVTPQQMVDFLSLVGDSSDNVPGAKGIGPKGAQKLLTEYGTLDNILNAADHSLTSSFSYRDSSHDKSSIDKLLEKVRNSKKDILLSKQLVLLNKNIPLNIKLSDLIILGPKIDLLKELAKRLEFKDLFNLVESSAEGKSATELKPSETANLSEILNKHEGLVGIVLLEDFICITDGKQTAFKKTTDLSMDEKNRIFEVLSDDKIRKIGHGFKNILHAVNRDNPLTSCLGAVPLIKLRNIFDTETASSLLSPGLSSKRGTTKSDITRLALEYLGIVFKPEESGPILFELAQKLDAELCRNELKSVYEEIELPLIEVIYSMEKTGIKIDLKHLEKLNWEFENRLSELQHEIETMTGSDINLNSPKQISFLLFQKLNLQIEPDKKHEFKSKNGFSTGMEVLQSLLNAHPVIAKIIEHREISKLKSSFIVNLLETADLNHRVHTNFEPLGTSTGRFSSSKPNLQNIPVRSKHGQEIRKAFVAQDGYVLVSADYSQIDLRVLAHVSKDKCLLDAFVKDEDIHLKTASEVFKVQISQVNDEMRRRAKAINFGIIYGQTPTGLAQELNISKTNAKQYIEHYFNIYSGVRDWIESNLKYARETGYTSTFTGRKRYFPELNSSNARIRSFAERAVINMPIQGGSADIIKKAMINIYERINRESPMCHILLQVHDELLFEIPLEELKKVCEIIRHEMENSFKLSVPLKVDIKTGNNWNDMISLNSQL